ncbi:MAG: flagellar basal body rod protein FlgB [Bacteroidetes bacterium]|nr:flagellar basal body rod protein FlgB [Bacteroidota bacterium]
MPSSIKQLKYFIDYLVVKNDVLSKNIANIGTKNYKREDVVFKNLMNENMNSVLRTTSPKHYGFNNSGFVGGRSFQMVYDSDNDAVSGINNVDIDKEMTELAETTLLYRFTSRKIGNYFRSIQNVIRGGR